MRRYRILASLGALLIVVALAIGLTPVHGSLLITSDEYGQGGRPSISCGSALLKHRPTYSAPFTGLRLDGNDPCSVARDHRRRPVEITGGVGVVFLAAALIDALVGRRRGGAGGESQ